MVITVLLIIFSGFSGQAQWKSWTLEECINYSLKEKFRHKILKFRKVEDKTYIPVIDQYKDKFQEYLDKNFL